MNNNINKGNQITMNIDDGSKRCIWYMIFVVVVFLDSIQPVAKNLVVNLRYIFFLRPNCDMNVGIVKK